MRYQTPLVFASLLVYLLIGGIVFWHLESRYEIGGGRPIRLLRPQHRRRKSTFVESKATTSVDLIEFYTNMFDYVSKELDRKQQQQQQQQIQQHAGTLMSGYTSPTCLSAMDFMNVMKNWTDMKLAEQDEQHQQRWDFPGSILFAITIVTTIGYGNLVPRSVGGRVFCCLYAIIGIPLCLVALVNIGTQLERAARCIERRIHSLLTAGDKVALGATDLASSSSSSSRCDSCCRRPRCRYMRSVVITVIGGVAFLLVPAAIFRIVEDWDYATAVYFAVVSLSTIGFGDYVAGINYVYRYSAAYRLLVGVWIFMGLAWLAGVMASLQTCYQSIVKRANANRQATRMQQEAVKPTLVGDGICPSTAQDCRSIGAHLLSPIQDEVEPEQSEVMTPSKAMMDGGVTPSWTNIDTRDE